MELLLSALPVWFTYPFFFTLGCCFGSFLGMLAYRLPRQQPWLRVTGVQARSACPSCQRILGTMELIPVLSWVLQKGRCKGCAQRISVRYALIEIITGMLFLALFIGLR